MAVLERFEIDPCTHAEESLDCACAELQLSVDQVREKLADAAACEPGAVPADLARYSISRLIQHIVRTHHQYVRRELPRLAEMARKLTGKHGDRAPELNKIAQLIEELHADMLAHLEKEEQILFPFIAEVDQDAGSSGTPRRACFRTVALPISMMMKEHDSAGRLVAEMRNLSHGFDAPAWACPTYIAFYSGLQEFENDFGQHVHLENDLLFPRAIDMEAKLNRRG